MQRLRTSSTGYVTLGGWDRNAPEGCIADVQRGELVGVFEKSLFAYNLAALGREGSYARPGVSPRNVAYVEAIRRVFHDAGTPHRFLAR